MESGEGYGLRSRSSEREGTSQKGGKKIFIPLLGRGGERKGEGGPLLFSQGGGRVPSKKEEVSLPLSTAKRRGRGSDESFYAGEVQKKGGGREKIRQYRAPFFGGGEQRRDLPTVFAPREGKRTLPRTSGRGYVREECSSTCLGGGGGKRKPARVSSFSREEELNEYIGEEGLFFTRGRKRRRVLQQRRKGGGGEGLSSLPHRRLEETNHRPSHSNS